MRNFLLRTTISLVFLAALAFMMKDDLPQIARILASVNKRLFALSALICLSTAFILAKRLQLIFEAEDLKLRMAASSNLTFIGYFFNNFLPTSVGGDIVKAMCAARLTGQTVKSVTSVLLDRMFGLFTFILIPSVSLLFMLKHMPSRKVPVIVYSFLAISIFIFFALFNKHLASRFKFMGNVLDRSRHGAKVKRVFEGLHAFKRHKGVVAQAMGLSLIGQSVSIFSLYCASLALGAEPQILYLYLLVPIVHLISMLPSLNGLGIREHAYVIFLSPYMGREYAAALGVVWLAFLFMFSVIGGVVYMLRHDYHIRFKEAAVS